MLLVTDSAEQVLLTAHKQPHRIAQTAHMIQKITIFFVSVMVLFSLHKEDQESQKDI